MKRHLTTALLAFAFVFVTLSGIYTFDKLTTSNKPTSGIYTQNFDTSVRPQDDFYRYVNGKWLDTTAIPADKAAWGSFYEIREQSQKALREIIETATNNQNGIQDKDSQKIGDLYKSFMNESKIETLGLAPLQNELAQIDSVKNKKEIPGLIAHLSKIGVTAPYGFFVHQDNRDATKYVVDLNQSGLGLPDRDYYLLRDAKLKKILDEYNKHVAKILALSGDANAIKNAKAVVALETKLARIQWTNTELRDPIKGYNRFEIQKLDALAPDLGLKNFLSVSGLDGKINYIIVGEPSYFKKLNGIFKKIPISVWQSYFRFHLISGYAPYLSKEYINENFAFNGTILSGVPEMKPRWQRGVSLVDNLLGEAMGKLYVAKYFPPENKIRVEKLVNNLLESYKQSIEKLEWMNPQTKKEALGKLSKFTMKIGYPKKWIDYSTLEIKADDLVGNVMRANIFEDNRNIAKLGKPIDREEWHMSPQTINAYYNSEMNEIVFPAAILQPPFFNAKADNAVNYGGIGVIIGHEISHGFDDNGSQYDGTGNLRNWWTTQDQEKFAKKTKALVSQYSAYEPVKGYHVNGDLTLGENIADNSGATIAFKAYHLSLGNTTAPIIDGFTGDERFYIGFAQVWRSKIRENVAITYLKSDPHSPDQSRTNGTLVNQQGFYETFGAKEGDKMYLPPEKRVSIW
jgi:predicted metalloendopeptidase